MKKQWRVRARQLAPWVISLILFSVLRDSPDAVAVAIPALLIYVDALDKKLANAYREINILKGYDFPGDEA